MKSMIYAALAVLIGLTSCERTVFDAPLSIGQSALNITIDGFVLKSGSEASSSEKLINSIQVLVFASDGSFEKEAQVTINADKTSAEASVVVSNGQKTIYAVANVPQLSGSSYTSSSFGSLTEDLSLNSPDSFIMSGRVEKNVTGNTGLSITLKRLVSKVCLMGVTRNFSDAGKSSLPLVIEDVYLSNVPGTAPLTGVISQVSSIMEWYNRLGVHSDLSLDALLYHGGINRELAQGASWAPSDVVFYAYRNPSTSLSGGGSWSPRVSRLVVKTRLAGLATPYYYVANLPQLEPNRVYNVSLTLTRPGSPDPDTPDGEGEVCISVTPSIIVSDWDGAMSVNENF